MKRRVKLGQHFLIDRDILAEIISCNAIKKGEKVIEVGPGRGVLTKELLEKGAKVTAVEIDSGLVDILRKELGGNKNFKIINEDILRTEFSVILNLFQNPVDKIVDQVRDDDYKLNDKYKIVGNIPYQITSPLLRKIFKLDNPPEIIVFMVQKEVAERICAKPGDSRRGFLSVIVQYYGRPEIVKIVPRESFYPAPKVESAILKIKIKKAIIVRAKSRTIKSSRLLDSPTARSKNNDLFKIVQAGFSQKRKKLRNSLAGGLHLEPKVIDKILQKAGINPNLRAEDLDIKDWKRVSRLRLGSQSLAA